MPNDRVENRDQLQTLLRDLFQFDASELDFGVYRILNQRRDRIERFIEEDLLDAVEEGLESLATSQREDLRERIHDLQESIREEFDEDALAPDGSLNPPYDSIGHEKIERYRELRDRLDSVKVAEETEARIFNDLYRFFSRYYDDGDFHTKRRISSKDSKYYVPYNGEETYFHWANRDQYYVKTSEHFTDYRFDAEDISVEFQLEDADVPQDNIKGDGRYFVLGRGDPVSFDTDERKLSIAFQYRQITESEADDIVEGYNEATDEDRSSFARMTLDMRCDAIEGWILDHVEDPTVERALTSAASENGDNPPSRLKRQLRRYVSENTMDYFVHKDLGGFLRGELEFFLQNEVLDVEGLINSDESVPPDVLRARTMKQIAERIIAFLAQIEDFQKRLFEKKKFVVQTDYMVTLDQVPERLYQEILGNNDQIEQWQKSYKIGQWEGSLAWMGEINEEFLHNHPSLMIDTKFFNDRFKMELLTSFEDFDEVRDGLLINGENYQALKLIMKKFRNQVQTTYIDPPYNTGEGNFIFKDQFRDSSWLSMMSDRLDLAFELLEPAGTFFCHIDEHEISQLHRMMNNRYGERNNLGEIVWNKMNPKGDSTGVAIQHEYILSWTKEFELFKSSSNFVKLKENAESMLGKASEIYNRVEEGGLSLEEANREYQQWIKNQDLSGGEAAYRYIDEEGKVYRPVSMAWPNKNDPPDDYKYDLVHPETGEVCKKPKRGWRFPSSTLKKMKENGDILFGEDHTTIPNQKYILEENLVENLPSVLSYGGSADQLFTNFDLEFEDNPKPMEISSTLLETALGLSDEDRAIGEPILIDFFAGSGTAAHTAIKLERDFDVDIGYILVEMGEHFDTVVRPRLQKAIFSSEWSEGIPDNTAGLSHLIKYQSIESYEDSLNNISIKDSSGSQETLLTKEYPDYVSGYMLDFESKDSPPLLPEGAFDEPFDFELEIEQNGTSREPTAVDLVETFHYLIGAYVRQYFHESHQDRRYVVTECEVETESTTEQVLTVWRKTEGLDLEAESEWFDDEFDTASYDRVYVNGESFIAQSEPLAITFRERMEAPPDVT